MPDDRHIRAVQQVEGLLKRFCDVRVLANKELATYENKFVQGWEIPKLCSNSDYNLRVLLDKEFPFHPPRIAVSPAPSVLEWPNLEKGGMLCLLSDSANISITEPTAVVSLLLNDAKALVDDNLAGNGLGRFEDEFHRYWTLWENTKIHMGLLCQPEGPSRFLSAWYGENFILVAEDVNALQNWLGNRFGKDTIHTLESQRVPLVWLPRPPHPSEYPSNVSEILLLLRRNSANNEIEMVEQLLLDERIKFKSVVLGFDTQHGAGFAGLRIQEPKKRSGNPLNKGFRNRPPDNIFLMRYGPGQTVGANVTRFDASWIHGRDQNNDVSTLAGKSVVIIGCGSLGSLTAELLAKAGVGKISFVDHDLLKSENVGRHALGVDSVGGRKVDKLVYSLSTRFPHLSFKSYPEKFEYFIEEKLNLLLSADLMISVTGSWGVESLLNSIFCKSVEFPSVLYGWLEPYATAGHAFVLLKEQGCLRCLMDDLGKMRLPATEWGKKDTMISVPACGGLFQPYGPVELAHVCALVADLALDVLLKQAQKSTHRVWLGSKKLLDRMGGIWNPAWIERYGNPGANSLLCDIDFEIDPNCPECRTS